MSERWYKQAVIYCIEVDILPGLRRRRLGRPPGADQPPRLPLPARRDLPVAQPDPSRARIATPATTSATTTASTRGSAPSATSSSCAARRAERGIRILLDLVVNHTSDQHPWFRAPRSSPGLAVPRLVRLERRRTAGPAAGHRLPRRADRDLDLRRRGRSLVLPPVLRLPARPELDEPGRARARSARSWASGCSSAPRASASTRPRSSSSRSPPGVDPGAEGLRDPRRLAPGPAVAAAATRCCCARPTSTPTTSRTTPAVDPRRPERPRAHAVRLRAQPARSGSRWPGGEAEPLVEA